MLFKGNRYILRFNAVDLSFFSLERKENLKVNEKIERID